MPSVDFETKCWEQDWRLICEPNYLSRMIERCNYAFQKRRVIINNVGDLDLVAKALGRLVSLGVIDEFCTADALADEALARYQISRPSFRGGYYYSIAELVGIMSSSADYLLHFSSDSIMEGRIRTARWVGEAVAIMQERDDVIVANPAWNWRFRKAAAVSEGRVGDFYVECGFSDQCYLIKRAVFDAPIYGHDHPDAAIFPAHGGNSFERRAFSFMRACGKKRITHSKESYWHRNIGQTPAANVRSLASVSALRWLRKAPSRAPM
jgi:hypothetical protein